MQALLCIKALPMNILQRLRITFTAGLLLLLPLAVFLIIALKVLAITNPLMEKLAHALGIEHGVRTLAVLVLVLICLLAGLLIRSTRVSSFRDRLERNVLNMIPGYEYIRQRMAESLGQDAEAAQRAILVRFDDGLSPGRLVEEGADGRCVVFVPDVPQGNSGALFIMDADRVQRLDVPYGRLEQSIRSHGKGLFGIVTGSVKQAK